MIDEYIHKMLMIDSYIIRRVTIEIESVKPQGAFLIFQILTETYIILIT